MKTIWLCAVLVCSGAFLPCPAPAASDAPSQTGETDETARPFRLVPQASILMPKQFVLSRGGYSVPYSDSANGMPLFYLGFTTHLARVGDYELSLLGRAGYTYRFGPTPVRDPHGSTGFETVQLSWVPLAAGLRVAWEIPQMHFLKPNLSFGGGAHFFHQSGDRPQLDGSFWVPYGFLSPGVTFFEGGSDWFNGFGFGMTYQSSLGEAQLVRGWSFDLSVNFLL